MLYLNLLWYITNKHICYNYNKVMLKLCYTHIYKLGAKLLKFDILSIA
jgi:hypothetical protein